MPVAGDLGIEHRGGKAGDEENKIKNLGAAIYRRTGPRGHPANQDGHREAGAPNHRIHEG